MSRKYHKYIGPKRQVFRYCYILGRNPSASVTHDTIFTADEDMTLIRVIIRLDVLMQSTTAGANEWSGMLSIFRKGNQIASDPSYGEHDVGELPEEEIARFSKFQYLASSVGVHYNNPIREDIKGMRKLKKSDEITWSGITRNASNVKIQGPIIMFFKRT